MRWEDFRQSDNIDDRRDDETDEFIPAMIKEYGIPDDGRALTDFDLIEIDEERWHPDMWREAWK